MTHEAISHTIADRYLIPCKREDLLAERWAKAAKREGQFSKTPVIVQKYEKVTPLTKESILAADDAGLRLDSIAAWHGVSRGALDFWMAKHFTCLRKMRAERRAAK